MRRTLRLGRSAVLLVAVVIVAAGVHFLHAYQLTRNSGVLLDQAEQAQKQAEATKKAGDSAKAADQLGKAADYLGRYLGLHRDEDDPRSKDALAKYGLVLKELAKSPLQKQRAFLVLEKAVRLDPGRDDVRRQLAQFAVELNRTIDARDHLDYLLKNSSPHDAELEVLMGRCEEADGQYQKAANAYQQARTDDPKRVEAYVQLAEVLRTHADQAKLDKIESGDVLSDLKALNLDSVPSLLTRGRYLATMADVPQDKTARDKLLAEAARDVAKARGLAPDDVDVLLVSADVKEKAGNPEGAQRDLEQGWKAHPTDARFLLGQVPVELRAGKRDAALEHLNEALPVIAGNAEQQWLAANLFLDAGQPDKARELLVKMNVGGGGPAVDYIQARLDVADGKFAAAAALLEERRKDLAKSPELGRQGESLLGLCYERLGNADQRLAAFRRAADLDPAWLPGRLGKASALLAAGKLDDALAEYGQLVKAHPESAEARLQAVRLLIVRNLRLPLEARRWADANQLVDDAPEELKKTADFRLTKANLLAAEGSFADAWKALDEAVAADKKEVRYRLLQAELADFGQGRKDWKPEKTSDEILKAAESEVGDSGADGSRTVDLRLARAARLARLAPEEAVKGLAALEKGDAFEAPDRARLFAGLAEAYARAGDFDKAARLCGQARDLLKDDLGIRLRLFDLSLRAFEAALNKDKEEGRDRDVAALQEIAHDVQGIEGAADGVLWRTCEASLLLFQARHGGDKGGLKDARALLTEVIKRRPGWSRPPLLEAELEEMDGELDAAIARYRQAIDLGERQPEVIRHAVQLLASRRRYDEAQEVLHKIGTGGDLGRLAVEVSLLNRDSQDVAGLVKSAADAAKDSKDYHDFLWLGQVHEAMGKHEEAETAFRKAVDLDPSAPEPRTALVLFLAGKGDEGKAKAADELAKAGKDLPPEKAAAVLAVGYEALGQRDKAEEQYAGLLKAKPDVADRRAAAAFYLRGGDVAKATPLLKQIIDAPGQSDEGAVLWARRTRAITMAASGDYKQSSDALDLIEQNLRRRNEPEDQRAKALVLASRPGPHARKDSIEALEESFARLRPTADEEFLLARLYESDGAWGRANEHFLAVAGARGGANPFHLAYYVQALLRHDDVNEADAWLQRLKKAEPGSARTVGAEARVLARTRKDKGAAAAQLVNDFVDKDYKEKKNPAVLADAAALLEELGRMDDAEKRYREYVKAVEADQPEKALVLAGFLARRDRLGDALDVIEAAAPKAKAEAAGRAAVAAVRVGAHPTAQHFQRVEGLLRDAIAKNPSAADLSVSLADLHDAEGKDAEAEADYRKILHDNPRNPIALNNLAWLLAFQPGKPQQEALDLVEQRVQITGPSPSVLDTRGMILLKLGRADEAAQSFADAAAQAPTAVYYFHLAEAQKAAGRLDEAKKAWLNAKGLGFKKTNLHPLELAHPDYDEKWFEEDKDKGN